MQKKRCAWSLTDPLYIDYHDHEWGVPVHDDRLMFEFLILEGMQAGLSWLTILKKREHFRHAFDNFNPEKIARYSAKKINSLMQDANIIRNRLKINATVGNAQAMLTLQDQGISLSELLWSFVNHQPIQNRRRSLKDIPAITPASVAMSKHLKKLGFNFVGPTICYAHMQAVGMVNDHLMSCYRYKQLNK